MEVTAEVRSGPHGHHVTVRTGDAGRELDIPGREGGGSAVNGGQLLFLALATCYCNDVYREATKRGIEVTDVEVTVTGEFGAEGEPGRNIRYSARIAGRSTEAELMDLARGTDGLAEVQNTLRQGVPVMLERIEVEATG